MALADKLGPWSGSGFRHLPSHVPADKVLDTSRAGLSTTNRWNVAGDPTLYVAGDVGVAIAEWARHFEIDRNPALLSQTIERIVYRLDIVLDHVLDLRDPEICADLMLNEAPACFLDIAVARTTAGFLRHATRTQAILVPSVAMLDKLDRWNLVLFLDKMPADLSLVVTSVQAQGPFRWR